VLKNPQHFPNFFPSLSLQRITLLLLFINLIIVGRQTIVKTSFTEEDFVQKIRKNYQFILSFHFLNLISDFQTYFLLCFDNQFFYSSAIFINLWFVLE